MVNDSVMLLNNAARFCQVYRQPAASTVNVGDLVALKLAAG
jgi:hypothetical protein